ncbi:MAG: terminase small subunit [Microcoleus sp.]
MPKGDKLTPMQRRFWEEYRLDFNGTQAAIRAGFSPRTARQYAVQLLSSEKGQEYLRELMAEQQQRTNITADCVLKELAYIGFSRITDVIDIETGGIKKKPSDKVKAAINSVQVTRRKTKEEETIDTKVRMHDKIRALEKLGVHLGLFNDLNAARATLLLYGDLEIMEDGSHVFRPIDGRKTPNAVAQNKVSTEESSVPDLEE